MPQVPSDPDLVKIIKDLQRRVSDLETRNPLSAGATINSGGLTLNGGGGITVIDPTTDNVVTYIGTATTVDGARQMVALFIRDDGTPALELGDFGVVPGHPHQQALQWFDRSGSVVFADDTVSGFGHARPYIGLGTMTDTNTSRWPSTTSGTFTTVCSLNADIVQPRIKWIFTVYAPAAVTAQYRLLVNGTQIGATFSVANDNFGTFADIQPIPAGINYGDTALLELQARVSAGSGTVLAQQMQLVGAGS